MKKPTAILADDHTLVLEGFRRLLDTHCELLATVGDGQALLQAVATTPSRYRHPGYFHARDERH